MKKKNKLDKLSDMVKEGINVNEPTQEKEDYRISIKNKTEKEIKEEQKKEKKKKKENQKYEQPYTILRKEIDGIAPLYKLNFLDKFKVVFRFREEKSGKKARREAEALRRQQLKIIKIESSIRKNINDKLEKLLDKEIQEAIIEVKVPNEYSYLIDKVLSGSYYTMFDIDEVQINTNMKKYIESIPRIFHFRLK